MRSPAQALAFAALAASPAAARLFDVPACSGLIRLDPALKSFCTSFLHVSTRTVGTVRTVTSSTATNTVVTSTVTPVGTATVYSPTLASPTVVVPSTSYSEVDVTTQITVDGGTTTTPTTTTSTPLATSTVANPTVTVPTTQTDTSTVTVPSGTTTIYTAAGSRARRTALPERRDVEERGKIQLPPGLLVFASSIVSSACSYFVTTPVTTSTSTTVKTVFTSTLTQSATVTGTSTSTQTVTTPKATPVTTTAVFVAPSTVSFTSLGTTYGATATSVIVQAASTQTVTVSTPTTVQSSTTITTTVTTSAGLATVSATVGTNVLPDGNFDASNDFGPWNNNGARLSKINFRSSPNDAYAPSKYGFALEQYGVAISPGTRYAFGCYYRYPSSTTFDANNDYVFVFVFSDAAPGNGDQHDTRTSSRTVAQDTYFLVSSEFSSGTRNYLNIGVYVNSANQPYVDDCFVSPVVS